MLGLHVFLNGRRLCRAGVRDDGVLSAMVAWAPDQTLAPRARQASKKRVAHLEVGGLHHPKPGEDAFPKWIERALRVGDRVTVRVVEGEPADPPAHVEVLKHDWIATQERAYYERMKKRFDRPAAGKKRGASRRRGK